MSFFLARKVLDSYIYVQRILDFVTLGVMLSTEVVVKWMCQSQIFCFVQMSSREQDRSTRFLQNEEQTLISYLGNIER